MAQSWGALGVREIRAGILSKEFSARELTEGTLENIRQYDGSIHSFLEVTEELAHAAADRIDEAIARGEGDTLGILAGVPMGYKDNLNLIGTHTTCASRMLENYVSPYTASCVARTLEAGAIPIGKLNMDEFAFGSSTETSAFGPTRNPWNLDCVPGGSSGGSAAAVAAGLLPATLGSDTGGSIRQPGAFCGVIGLKPTYGVVSRYGVVAFGSSLDQVGPFTRSVADAACVLDAIAGRDELDCTSQENNVSFTERLAEGAAGMRVGVVRAFLEAKGLTNEVKARLEEAIEVLKQQGLEIVEVELPHTDAAISAYFALGPCEAFSNLARFDSVRYGFCDAGHKDLGGQYEASRSRGFGPEVRRRIMLGSYLLSSGVYDTYYYPAQQIRTLITRDYTEAFKRCDAILAPVAPSTAFKLGEIQNPVEMHLADMFTVSINIAGNGGMSVPCGFGAESGMPVGVQIISPAFRDENMLRIAAALEQHYGSAPVAPVVGDFAGGGDVAGGSVDGDVGNGTSSGNANSNPSNDADGKAGE